MEDLGNELYETGKQFVDSNSEYTAKMLDNIQKNYKEFLYTQFPIVIGCLLYIIFFVLAKIVYKPSYNGCLNYQNNSQIKLLVILTNTLMIALILVFMFQSMLSPDLKALFDFAFIPTLTANVFIMFVIFGILYFNCQDCIDCNHEKTFNDEVSKSVLDLNILKTLENYYKNNINPTRAELGKCTNFYDSSYRTKSYMGLQSCNKEITTQLKCNDNPDPDIGAPILSEFYIMTSNKTCLVRHNFDFYVSTKMIEISLFAGARCLDFDIYPLSFSRMSPPIVSINRDSDNRNMHHNYVLFKDCLETIVKTYFRGKLSNNDPGASLLDPLFIHLNIHPTVNRHCCDQIATLIQYYFHEFAENKLYSSKINENLGTVPICHLFGKVIIMVRQVDPSVPITPSLIEVTNMLAKSNVKDKEWVDIQQVVDRSEFMNYNRRHLTFVRSSLFPYSNVSPDKHYHPKNHHSDFSGNQIKPPEINQKDVKSDSVTKMLGNKTIINNDPTGPIQYSCQFVAMNFCNLDDNMYKYLGFFKNTSFILKPLSLRRKTHKYTQGFQGKYNSTPKVSCDSAEDDLHGDDVHKEKCASKSSDIKVQVKREDLQTSNKLISQKADTVNKKPVFYDGRP